MTRRAGAGGCGTVARPTAASMPEVARAEDGALLEQHVALGDVVAGGRMCWPGLGGPGDADLRDARSVHS